MRTDGDAADDDDNTSDVPHLAEGTEPNCFWLRKLSKTVTWVRLWKAVLKSDETRHELEDVTCLV